MTFDGTQKVIGKGAQAEVLLYHGFAYKVYKESYPAEWIDFEKQQQQAVNKACLCDVKYYDTDDPLEATGIPLIVKNLFTTSKDAVVPPRRAQTKPAPTFIVLSK